MQSAVYRQDSNHDRADAKLDPQNVWLWRFGPRRLEAEVIRDSLLAVSGLLDAQMFGPGTLDADSRRRSIYFTVKRSKLMPTMTLFDAPQALVSQGRRISTTIAPQALLLMNSPQVRNYATGLAGRVTPQEAAGSEHVVNRLYEITLGRAPRAAELAAAVAFLRQQSEAYQQRQSDGHRPTEEAGEIALVDLCQAMISLNEFIYVE